MTNPTELKRYTYPDEAAFPEGIDCRQSGFTKREYFAALAMQGAMADPSREGHLDLYASDAVKAADALIEALNNPEL